MPVLINIIGSKFGSYVVLLQRTGHYSLNTGDSNASLSKTGIRWRILNVLMIFAGLKFSVREAQSEFTLGERHLALGPTISASQFKKMLPDFLRTDSVPLAFRMDFPDKSILHLATEINPCLT